MKECLFCFETIVDSENVCGSCKSLQPAKSKIDRRYRLIIRWLAISDMFFWKASFWAIIYSVLLSLPISVVLAPWLSTLIKMESSVPIGQAWKFVAVILAIYFVRKVYKFSLVKAVSTKGYFIEEYLRKKL